MKWIECLSCTTEFRVVSESDEPVTWCPYCGNEIEFEDDEDPEDDY